MHCNVSVEYLAFLDYEEFGMNMHIECHSSVVSSLCLYLKLLSVSHWVTMVLITSIIKGNVGLHSARIVLCFVCIYSTFLVEALKTTGP
jgi:hypothetical protein